MTLGALVRIILDGRPSWSLSLVYRDSVAFAREERSSEHARGMWNENGIFVPLEFRPDQQSLGTY